jgi:hypothetical protein
MLDIKSFGIFIKVSFCLLISLMAFTKLFKLILRKVKSPDKFLTARLSSSLLSFLMLIISSFKVNRPTPEVKSVSFIPSDSPCLIIMSLISVL